MSTQHPQHNQGFSLVELLVAMAIFTIVITMSVGTLLVLIDANAKAQNIQTAMTNLTFALDSMTREIRTGTNFVCRTYGNPPNTPTSETHIQDCPAGGNFVSVVEGGTTSDNDTNLTGGPADNNRIDYYYDDNFYTSSGAGAILRRLGDGDWYPITPESMNMTSVQFVVTGTRKMVSQGNLIQPTMTIIVQGTAGNFSDTDATYEIQTTVAQRTLDF